MRRELSKGCRGVSTPEAIGMNHAEQSEESPGVIDDAERAVLAAMMLGPEAIGRALLQLRCPAFHRVAHGHIFAAIRTLHERGETADLLTVTAELAQRGDLATVGGPAFVAGIMTAATTAANVEAYARIVQRAWVKREALSHALALQARATDPTCDPADVLAFAEAGHAAIADMLGRARTSGGLAAPAVSASDFRAREIPTPVSLLGDSILVAGGFGILYGQPGLGKSWLALELAHAVARGVPWLGLVTPGGGARVGLLQLELGKHALQQRLRVFGDHERDSELSVVCGPADLPGGMDLCRAGDVAMLRSRVKRDRLDLLVIDAFNRAHTANENKAEEIGPVLNTLDRLRHETGCAVQLVHHERKSGVGSGDDDDLDALRGSSRLQSDPTLHMRVKRTKAGQSSITFVKVSEGAMPAPIMFRLRDNGRPEVVTSPGRAVCPTRDRVLQAVLRASQPVPQREIAAALSLSPATIKRHLEALVEAGRVKRIGENKATRYRAPTGSPAHAAQSAGRAGELSMSANGLGDSAPATGSGSPVVDCERHQLTSSPALPYGESNGGEPVSSADALSPDADEANGHATDADGVLVRTLDARGGELETRASESAGGAPEPETSCPACGGRLLKWDFGPVCTDCHRKFSPADGGEPDGQLALLGGEVDAP